MAFIGSSLSERGYSHIQANVVCQDASMYHVDKKGCFAIAVVCDGHGSAKHFRSDIGAQCAVEAALSVVSAFLGYAYKNENKEINEKKILEIEKNIIFKWNHSVEKHLADHAVTEEELSALSDKDRSSAEESSGQYQIYGTTLVLVAITETYCFGIQIGDGDCLVRKQTDEFVSMMPKDERLVFNITTSLCDKSALQNFRHFILNEQAAAALVSTDGIRNSFNSDEKYVDFIRMVADSFIDSKTDAAEEDLKEFLPKLSKDGSGDDVSISLILREKIPCANAKDNEPS